MKSITFYVPEEQLIKTAGNKYKDILKDLKDEGILKDYKSVLKITVDKDKALHIQTILEFYDVKDVSFTSLTKSNKKDE